MSPPLRAGASLDAAARAAVRRRAIFECHKWDPQVGDVDVLAPFPLILAPAAWAEIAGAAERLSAEIFAAEDAIAREPALLAALGVPWRLRGLFRAPSSTGIARFIRFDFHHTPDGWRISEANVDVPGGFNEASGVAPMIAAHFPDLEVTGDPAGALVSAVRAKVGDGARVGFVHATAFTDDRSVMQYLATRAARLGLLPTLLAPDHVTWVDGRARIAWGPEAGPLDALVRFFPAEWLPNLPRASRWPHFFRDARTPIANPGRALLTQTKRFPLLWDRLPLALATWRALLPETRDVRASDLDDPCWVVKPALGRLGDGIWIAGVTAPSERAATERDVRRHPEAWVAQRRFEAVPIDGPAGPIYPSIGVYTVDGRVCGAYGRAARRPLIDSAAVDCAVCIPKEEAA